MGPRKPYRLETGQGPAQMMALTLELVDHYGLGMVSEAAGIQGGAQLKQKSAELFAGLAEDAGVEPTALMESSQAAQAVAWISRVQAAGKALGTAAQRTIAAAGKNLGLLFVAGGLYIAHDYLTTDKQVQLAGIREMSKTVRPNWAAMSPQERTHYAKMMTGPGGPSTNTVLLVGLGVVGVIILSKIFKK
jgi:hypothetical protein